MLETDLNISHPQISTLYNLYLLETQPFRKVHRMIDLFETIIKMHTVVIMGEYFKRNELSEMAKAMLAYGLQTPSLGTWQKFSRDLCSELISNNHPFVLNHFQDEFLLFDKENKDKTNVISFRNSYAHGATPTDEDCEADILQFEHFLLKLLDSKWFKDSQLIILDNTVFIQSKTTLEKLNLHPILVCKEEANGQPFTFFNDIKDEKVGLLNYPLSKHYREQKTYIEEFYAVLPLKEWKRNVSNEFKQYIEELTEGFKGRIMELKAIATFIETKEKGYLSIQGNPGIGKSALIAQISRELNKSEYNKKYKLCEYFIRRGTRTDNNLNLLSYLLKTTDIYYPEGKSILPEGNNNWELQQALFAKWTAFGNGNSKFKLLFLIDGLDEGVENDILNYLPRENFKNILFIYGSRHGGHLKLASFWTELPIENHETILLGGLNKEDIRAFLYEVVNKYEIEQTWIDEILNRSEGNPLYLKLLCNALENGSIEINNSKALPKEIDSYYKAILNRYAQQPDGDALIECLLLFAVALDYLTPAHLGIMNSMSVASQQRAMSVLTEVLYENPLTDLVLDYQLFHESFREYLIKTYPLEIKKANQKIIDSCQKWQTLDTLFEQQYVLEHFATHLIKSGLTEHKEVLVELSKNEAFQKMQKQVLRNYNANFSLLRAAMTAASELENKEEAIEIGLRLVDLQNEENNDVQSILDMVANNEMELATLRIKNFGGAAKEDKQRQFILLLLCLMELTLLGSKEKSHKKEGIEALLQTLEDEIPVDHSLLSWHDFFPSYLVFLISVEIKKIDLDYVEIYKRTKKWDLDWIKNNGPYTAVQIKVMIGINDEVYKSGANTIAIALVTQGELDKAIKLADGIDDDGEKNKAFCEIAEVFYNQGKLAECSILIDKAIQTAESIKRDGIIRSKAFCDIAEVLYNQGKLVETSVLIEKAIQTAEGITAEGIDYDWEKSEAFCDIAEVVYNQGKLAESKMLIEKAIQTAEGINNELHKSIADAEISIVLAKQGEIEKAIQTAEGIDGKRYRPYLEIAEVLYSQGKLAENTMLIEKATQAALGRKNDFKNNELQNIAAALASQGEIEKAMQTAEGIDGDADKSKAFCKIAEVFYNQGKLAESTVLIEKALETVAGEKYEWRKARALRDIVDVLVNLGETEKAIQMAESIDDDKYKSEAFYKIAEVFYNQGKMQECSKLLLKVLRTFNGIGKKIFDKSSELTEVSIMLANQGKIEKAIQTIEGIKQEHIKSYAFYKIAAMLNSQGELTVSSMLIEKAIQAAESIESEYEKSEQFVQIAEIMYTQGKLEESGLLLTKALQTVDGAYNFQKSDVLSKISIALANRGKIIEAVQMVEGIKKYESYKCFALIEIAAVLAKNGNTIESNSLITKAIQIAECIVSKYNRNSDQVTAFRVIAIALANLCKIDIAIQTVESIDDSEPEKISAYREIAVILLSQGKLAESTMLIEKAIQTAEGIDDDRGKSKAYHEIAIALAKQGELEKAIQTAEGIYDDDKKRSAYRDLAIVFANKGELEKAINLTHKINKGDSRMQAYQDIGKIFYEKNQLQYIHQTLTQLPNDEAVLFYKRGMANAITATNANASNVLELLALVKDDKKSTAHLLQMHALYLCFFENTNPIKMHRLNKTLNIQWALDITANFEKESARASHNVQDWINEIEDENDREDILSWAEKVEQGKMTEEKFLERIGKL